MKLEEIDITNISIQTGHLELRPFEEKDLDDLHEYCKVEGVGESAGWKHHQSKDETAALLKSFIDGHRTFAITDKSNGKVIGSIGLEESSSFYSDKGIGENVNDIGYVLSKDYWGKGYAEEAVRAVMGYAFCLLHLDAVTCGHFAGNEASRRIIEKCGLKYLGDGKFTAQTGEEHQASFYALTHMQYGVDYKS